MPTKNTNPETENNANTAAETESNNGAVTEREPLLENHSPAAALASAQGKETKRILIRERHEKDAFRHICVGNNPPAILPTEVEVEVVPEEYYALQNSMKQRQANKKEKQTLQREYMARKKYL